LLAHSLPKIPSQALFGLADRVSQNRVVAGLHFPTDIEAGKTIAIRCFELLKNVRSVWGPESENPLTKLTKDGKFEERSLRERVGKEFPQYA
jgi:membrane-associated phospholipid phosphatase